MASRRFVASETVITPHFQRLPYAFDGDVQWRFSKHLVVIRNPECRESHFMQRVKTLEGSLGRTTWLLQVLDVSHTHTYKNSIE